MKRSLRWIGFRAGLRTEHETDRGPDNSGPNTKKAERMITAARAAVLWERVWIALWPGIGLIGLYLVLALLGALDLLPAALRVALLFIIGGVLFRSFWLSFDPVKMPGWFDGARRLERDSGLANRPLTEGK